MTDEELYNECLEGDEEALSVLIDRYKNPLYAYLLRLTKNQETSEDIFQTIFVKLLKKKQKFDDKFKFAPWIYTMAHNAAMDFFRKENSRKEISINDIISKATGGDFSQPPSYSFEISKDPGPDTLFERKQLMKSIEKAFNRLSDDQKEIFLLRHYSNLSFKEISEIKKMPIGTVLARMSRAMASLRKILEKDKNLMQ